MCIMQKAVFSLAVILLAQVTLASGEQVAVRQNRPLIYVEPRAVNIEQALSEEADIRFDVVKTYTGWKNFFADLGLIFPFFQVRLSVQANSDEAPVKETHWEFPKEYFFPADARDIEGADVLVNVWRSFPVTARVRFTDGSEKTVTKWIDPEVELAQR